jgi:hypothetical protein
MRPSRTGACAVVAAATAPLLPAPTGLAYDDQDGTLSWNSVPGAQHYIIGYSEDGNPPNSDTRSPVDSGCGWPEEWSPAYVRVAALVGGVPQNWSAYIAGGW